MVGPFSKYGPEVAEACLAAGCHYTDTTGEQDWVLDAKTRWGEKFAAKGLLLSPGIAQMYTTGEIAANICLETPGIDTLDILVLVEGLSDLRLDPDDLRDPAGQVVLSRAEQIRRMGAEHPFRRQRSRPARPRFGDALGRHLASRLVQGRSESRQLQGARRRLRARGHGRVRRDAKDVRGADQAAASRPAAGGARQYRGFDSGRDAAARESARQHFARTRSTARARWRASIA